MVKVSLYYQGAKFEYFVYRLPLCERSTSNHHGFMTSTECL
jgi:hypothetical protein